MNAFRLRSWLVAGAIAAAVSGHLCSPVPSLGAVPQATNVLFVVGPSKHPPGTHEVAAGARLLKYCLEHAAGVTPVRADVVEAWPKDPSQLRKAATIVFVGDLFPGETLPEPDKVKAEVGKLMDRGCGMVCLHFATGLRAQHVGAHGEHPLLRWLGGYYAGRCQHHQSVYRMCQATLSPAEADHPVLRGWKAFELDDEVYWNNYFGPKGPAKNVTPLVTAMMPPEDPKKEVVAWAIQRPDGGRGVGIVVPHYYRNWRLDDLRILVLNAICWTAKLEIPAAGVRSPAPDLAAFGPASVDPKPRPEKKQK